MSSGSELGRIISYDTFAGLRGSGIPQHVVDVREMVDSVAAWALPGTLSSIPAEILVTLIGALMCECQVRVLFDSFQDKETANASIGGQFTGCAVGSSDQNMR